MYDRCSFRRTLCHSFSSKAIILEKVLVAEDDDTDLTKEMKERIKVDLEVRYLDSEFDHLLELSSFLDPRFKLNYVNNRAKVLEEIENEMSKTSTKIFMFMCYKCTV